jgi:hypothetical protein
MKYWEIIADNLSKSGWSWGCVSGVDSRGRTIFVADAHRSDGKRFAVPFSRRIQPWRNAKKVARQPILACEP